VCRIHRNVSGITPKAELGNRVLDLFPDCIVWHLALKMSDDWYGDYIKQLDRALLSDASALTKGALQVLLAALVFQGNAKIAHIVVANAELMVLEMSVATALAVECSSLVCVMDSTGAMADLLDPSSHLGQGLSLAACSALCQWFMEDYWHILHLWHVPSKEEWKIHHEAHKAAKAAQIPLHPSCRVSFDFVCAAKEMAYQKEWHKDFSDPVKQGRNFLELVGLNRKPLKPTTSKGGAWSLFLASGSNLMTARACRATVGHAPMGEYHLCFHPGELTHCWCPLHPLQTRDHILHVCLRAVHEVDQEPPFLWFEVLEFCKLNDWVFNFPPPWKGGNQTEHMAQCGLSVRGGGVGCCDGGWAVNQVLWSSWTFVVN